MEQGFIFDYAKCVGCHACMVACYAENSTQPPLSWRQVNTFNGKKIPGHGFLHQSLACNHCLDAPCLKACPAVAYTRDSVTGAIIHHAERCIGCKYCTWACPFDTPKFNISKGVVEKCNFCNSRLKDGGIPACTELCPTGALSFGPITVERSVGNIGLSYQPIRPQLNTLRDEVSNSVPQMDTAATTSLPMDDVAKLLVEPSHKIHSFDEWPLVLFTFIASAMSGWLAAQLIEGALPVNRWIFGFLIAIGAMLSTFHLGKPFRAARALLHVRTSWLSREILLFGLFSVLSLAYLFISSHNVWLIASVFVAVLMLGAIEMVYSVTTKAYSTPLHSANTILTALAFGAIFASATNFVVVTLAAKAILYLLRKANVRTMSAKYSLTSLVRFILGCFVPMVVFAFGHSQYYWAALASFTLGELIDRFDYYNDLRVETPTHNLYKSLLSRLRRGR